MKCIKVLVHQQPYKEILWSFGLEKLFSLRWSSSSWFLFGLICLPLWKSSCLITLEIWSLVLNLVLLSSKSKLTKHWFHRTCDTVIQCTIVLGLSLKDTRLHPNTLPIRSLLGVNFWVFHSKDLSPFLIRLTRPGLYFSSLFPFFLSFFHFIHFSQFFIPSSHNHDANECHEVNYSYSYVSPIPLELQSCHNSKIFQQFQQSQ